MSDNKKADIKDANSDEDEEEEEDNISLKEPQDVGSYTLEEKLVSAVWVHERIRNNMSWISLMKNFKARFGCEPPVKRTLRAWERKLFSVGTIKDGIRTGRPCARLMHVPYVKDSIAESPNLSLRERARELGLSRSTLLKILKDDLKMTFVASAEHVPSTNQQNKGAFSKQKKTIISPPTGIWKFIDSDSIEPVNRTKGNIQNEQLTGNLDSVKQESECCIEQKYSLKTNSFYED